MIMVRMITKDQNPREIDRKRLIFCRVDGVKEIMVLP